MVISLLKLKYIFSFRVFFDEINSKNEYIQVSFLKFKLHSYL